MDDRPAAPQQPSDPPAPPSTPPRVRITTSVPLIAPLTLPPAPAEVAEVAGTSDAASAAAPTQPGVAPGTTSEPAAASSPMAAAPVALATGPWAALFAHPRQDLLAGSVVFLVALPLCLGIAVACHAPPIAGIIAGICGGLVIPIISRAQLAVSGPAAGLTAIIVAGISELGSFSAFLAAVFLSGVFQVLLGALRAGNLAAIVPSTVIRSMLAAIGVILVGKQISLVLGVPASMVDFDSLVLSADRTTHVGAVLGAANPGAVTITVVSLALITTWPKNPLAKLSWMSSSLVVVVVGTLLAVAFNRFLPGLALPDELLIKLPRVLGDSSAGFAHPDWQALRSSKTWAVGLTIALVASIETLLSIEALDRLDVERRRTPKNRELVAHGVGNMAAGLLGGIPLTAVIVRGSTNIQAGARGKLATVFHGVLILVAVLALAPVLDHVPTACLAAILLFVGIKLASPQVLRDQLAAMLMHIGHKLSASPDVLRGSIHIGFETWVPYLVTLIAVIATDLLKGVMFGFLVSILVILNHATRDTVVMKREGKTVHIDFLRDGTFLVKPALAAILEDIKDGEQVIIDCSNEFIDADVREMLATFAADAAPRHITVNVRGLSLDGVVAPAH